MTKKPKKKIKTKLKLEENPSIGQMSRYVRQREVEDLYLNGCRAAEIHNLIGEKHGITAGTIRNDIVAIRKGWKRDLKPKDVAGARVQYLASLHSVRKKAVEGLKENSPSGPQIRGRDLKLVHEIDKEIARISGVALKSDTKNIAVTVEKAKEYLDSIMAVVFKHIPDNETRDLIVEDLALIDEHL